MAAFAGAWGTVGVNYVDLEFCMYLLGIALAVMFWKWSSVGGPSDWSVDDWIIVLVPFGLTIAWWAWADSSGYTKRKAMEVEDAKVKARQDQHRAAIGTLHTKKKK